MQATQKKRQAKKDNVRTEPRSTDGMEVVDGDGGQRHEVDPNQSHRQPADQQVRLCGFGSALLLHGQNVSAQVNDQPQ